MSLAVLAVISYLAPVARAQQLDAVITPDFYTVNDVSSTSASDTKQDSFSDQFVIAPALPSIEMALPTIVVRPAYSPFSCVSWVKYKRPDQTAPWGYPNKVQVYDISPSAGLIVVTTEGRVGHAAYVEKVYGQTMLVSECNYVAGKCTTRLMSVTDKVIRGYR